MTSPKDVVEMIESAGGKVNEMAVLEDGHGFATATFPLPKDHWLYAETKEYEAPPMPMRTGTDHPHYSNLRKMVREAAQYAVRSSTMNGKEQDFDPDALVQNMHIALFGYHTPDGLDSTDGWANPNTVPPAFDWPSDIGE